MKDINAERHVNRIFYKSLDKRLRIFGVFQNCFPVAANTPKMRPVGKLLKVSKLSVPGFEYCRIVVRRSCDEYRIVMRSGPDRDADKTESACQPNRIAVRIDSNRSTTGQGRPEKKDWSFTERPCFFSGKKIFKC